LCQGGSVFDPQRRVTIWSDEISLRRIRLADGALEELIHWPSTPRTGTTDEVHYSFCYPAAALMGWDASHKLRIAISLVKSLQTTQTLWSERGQNDAPSFKYYNPGYSEGHLNAARVRGILRRFRGVEMTMSQLMFSVTGRNRRAILSRLNRPEQTLGLDRSYLQ